MEALQILQADLLDLIFENRNKDYGAYALRKTYPQRLHFSLLLTATLVAGLSAASLFMKGSQISGGEFLNEREVVVEHFPDRPHVPEIKTPSPKTERPQLRSSRLTGFDIKPDEQVRETEVPPIRAVSRVDVIDRDGLRNDDLVMHLPGVDEGTGVLMPEKNEDESDIFYAVEIEAKVNPKRWQRWLQDHLAVYIERAAESGMPSGLYTVHVKFLVERDGSIADVRALNDPGFGLARGAEEVIQKGPRWSPGEQNGRKVRSYHTQLISFIIEED